MICVTRSPGHARVWELQVSGSTEVVLSVFDCVDIGVVHVNTVLDNLTQGSGSQGLKKELHLV